VKRKKSRFHTLAEKDKKRHESEMSNYKPPKGEKKRGKKKEKDPNAPKRSLSAFFWFCNDERAKVKATMPDSGVGDVAKELGRRWNACTEDQKSKYEALAAKDKARYEKEMAAYKKKQASSPTKAAPAKGKAAAKGKAKAAPVVEESEEEEDDDDEEEEDEDDDE